MLKNLDDRTGSAGCFNGLPIERQEPPKSRPSEKNKVLNEDRVLQNPKYLKYGLWYGLNTALVRFHKFCSFLLG